MEKTKSMFRTSAKELKTTFTLAVCAMLAALALILNSVASINIGPYVKIGFSGIPNQIADYLFGPITGCLFAGVLDIVKFFIRPDGPFFFGFTFNAMLAAFIYGCFYYKHKLTQGRFIISEKTEINYMQTKLIRLPSEEWHLPVEQIVHFNHLKRSGRKKRLFGIKENKMEYQYKLRPHHGLCISFFSVKKYSEKYKEHIKKIIAELENASIVCVTLQSDIFCEGCFSRLHKMEDVVLLIRFENMIKRFLNYVDGKKECYFRILNLNKLFMIIFCLVESVK